MALLDLLEHHLPSLAGGQAELDEGQWRLLRVLRERQSALTLPRRPIAGDEPLV